MPVKRGEEVAKGVLEPFLNEVLEGGDREAEDAFAGVDHREEVPERLSEPGEGVEV